MENEVKSLSEDLRLCVRNLVKNFKLIIYCTVVGIVLGALLGMNVNTNKYAANTTICNASFSSYEQILAMAQVFKDCGTIATSRSVAERATLVLGDSSITAAEIQEMIQVSYDSSESYLAQITCESTNPEVSVKVVNAVSDALVMEMNEMTGVKCVKVLDHAGEAEISSRATVIKIVLMVIMGVVGCLLPVVCVVFKVLFSKKIISVEDCTLDGKLSLLGVIPVADRKKVAEKK